MILIDDTNFITVTEDLIPITGTFILTTYFFSVIFLFLKKISLCIVSAWALLLFLAVKESNKILKYCPEDQTLSPLYLQPTLIVKVRDLYPTITILYMLYCNLIFDITYIRVKNKKTLFGFFNLKSLIWASFLSFFGLNKLVLKLVKFFLVSRYYKDISDYLSTIYFNPWDKRKLFYFNKQWHADSSPQSFIKFYPK